MCALAHILFYVTSVHIRFFMRTLESNLIFIMILNHCNWYFATSFSILCSISVWYCNRACAVQMYKALLVRCQRCTKKKITLRYTVIGTCAVQFLHYLPLYRNTQHYATLNCSVKRVYAPEAHKIILFILIILPPTLYMMSYSFIYKLIVYNYVVF